MYHPMLSFAVAQAHIDDLIRQGRHTSSHRHPVPPRSPAFESPAFESPAFESPAFDSRAFESGALGQDERRASLARRLARYAARRTRPSTA